MTMRLGDFDCVVARRSIAFRINKVEVRNSMGGTVSKSTRFTSCTGHPTCNTFPNGLPQNIEELPAGRLTGCPFVDTRAILHGP
jgi:hypothetical protein